MDSEARVNVHLDSLCELLQGKYCKVNSQVVNATNENDKQYRMVICRQGIQRKRRTEQLGLRNGKVMEL